MVALLSLLGLKFIEYDTFRKDTDRDEFYIRSDRETGFDFIGEVTFHFNWNKRIRNKL